MARKRPDPPENEPPENDPKGKPKRSKPKGNRKPKPDPKPKADRAHRAPRARGNWKRVFLEGLRTTANVTVSCEKANIPRSTVYSARSTDRKFASDMMAAIEEAMDRFEALLGERILKGSERVRRVEFFDAEGNLTRSLVETVQDQETKALLDFLAANRPEKWRHNFDPRKLADAFAALARGSPQSEHADDRPKVP